MSIRNYDELNSMHIDVLKELGNIGSGNAATAISSMLGTEVEMTVPAVSVLDYTEAIDFLGGPENIVVGMLVRINGDIDGMIMFILQKPFASAILKTFFDIDDIEMMSLGENEASAIREIGNIMAASYVNALSQISGRMINISVPSLTVDMLGAIMSVPAIEFGAVSDQVLFIDGTFILDNQSIKSNMILIPEINSLTSLLSSLGVDI